MGIKRTLEALAKFRKTMKKKWANPEFKAKFSQALKGHFVSEETKRKLSKAHLTISAEQEKQIIKFYANGLTVAEIETEFNVGQSVIFSCLKRNGIRKRSIGHRKGMPSWNKGIKFSEEQKAKLNMEGLKIGHPWNKGIPAPKETIDKLKKGLQNWISLKGHYPNWKGGLSFEPY